MGNYRKTSVIVDAILAKKPMHRSFLGRAIMNLSEVESAEVENYLLFQEREKITDAQIVESYLTIVHDTFIEEMHFREKGHYRFSTFAEAEAAVYGNADYMKRYMIGLALSSFWWSNHTQIRRFFQQQLPRISNNTGIYREVGPGHGMFFLESLRHCQFSLYEGIDISPTSVEMTKNIVLGGFFGDFKDANINIVEADFLEDKELANADFLVMGEVLEHVEAPDVFLKRAYDTTTDDSIFFLSTCINAPAVDHLYNPETVENLEQLFFEHDYRIVDKCIIPRDGATLEKCVADRLAINVAYVLGKGV